jgi:vancomycin permeability regulator SanA
MQSSTSRGKIPLGVILSVLLHVVDIGLLTRCAGFAAISECVRGSAFDPFTFGYSLVVTPRFHNNQRTFVAGTRGRHTATAMSGK